MKRSQLLAQIAALAPIAEGAADLDTRLEAQDWIEELTLELAQLQGLEREPAAGPILRWPS